VWSKIQCHVFMVHCVYIPWNISSVIILSVIMMHLVTGVRSTRESRIVSIWVPHGCNKELILNTDHQFNTAVWCESVCTLTRRFTLKIGKAFSTLLHLWFCLRIPSTIVTGLLDLFQNTGILTIVLVVQKNDMVAYFTILFILIVFAKFVQSPHGMTLKLLNQFSMWVAL